MQQVGAAGFNNPGVPFHDLICGDGFHDISKTENGVQRCTNLMAHVGQELAFQSGCGLGLGFGQRQLLRLRLQVADHLVQAAGQSVEAVSKGNEFIRPFRSRSFGQITVTHDHRCRSKIFNGPGNHPCGQNSDEYP